MSSPPEAPEAKEALLPERPPAVQVATSNGGSNNASPSGGRPLASPSLTTRESVAEAEKLELKVCGVDLSDILKTQLVEQAEVGRQALGFEVLHKSMQGISARTLELLGRLKSPPPMLGDVMHCVMVLLRKALPPRVPSFDQPPAEDGASADEAKPVNQWWQALSQVLSQGEAVRAEMESIDLDDVSPSQIDELEPFLEHLSFQKVRAELGVASFIWLWVVSASVICGAVHAVLPSEDAQEVVTRRSSFSNNASPLLARPKTNNGSPITGRPSYSGRPVPGAAAIKPMRSGCSTPSNCSSNASPQPDRRVFASTAVGSAGASPLAQRGGSFRVAGPASLTDDGLPLGVSGGSSPPSPSCMQSASCSGCAGASSPKPANMLEVEPTKFLGAGAFANVFMCRNRKTGELLAMKCILKSLALKKNKHRQVKAEKAALEACEHHCIISLFATFSDEQHVYLLMELALGGELFALIEEMGSLDERDARFYAASVTLALEHLHSKGFIFRDMKPENLLLNSGGNLKLCDLGLAKKAERAWTLVGTPQYLAPEVLRGEGATNAVDWWGLGVLVFEMLCGALPFEGAGGDEALLFDAIRRGTYAWPETLPKIIAPDGGGGHSRGLGEQPPSAEVKETVAGLLRQSLPMPSGEPPLSAVRLGAGPSAAMEVRASAWLADFDWHTLEMQAMEPPYVPRLASEDDDSNFGPLEWRGEPILHAPQHDTSTWDSLFEGW